MPICGAASPIPGARYMVSSMSSIRRTMLPSMFPTGLALAFRTGSGAMMMGRMAMEPCNEYQEFRDRIFRYGFWQYPSRRRCGQPPLLRLKAPRRMVQRLQLRQFGVAGRYMKVAEPAGADQHPRLQGADRTVVAVHRLAQLAAQPVHMTAQVAQALVKLDPQIADFPRVARQMLLPPAIGHSAQQRYQGGWGRQDHAIVDPRLDQAGIVFQRRAEEVLAGQEQHDELGRCGELVPVCLAAQVLHVVADMPGVADQRVAAPDIVGRADAVQIRLDRRLGIDHDDL